MNELRWIALIAALLFLGNLYLVIAFTSMPLQMWYALLSGLMLWIFLRTTQRIRETRNED